MNIGFNILQRKLYINYSYCHSRFFSFISSTFVDAKTDAFSPQI